MLYDIWESIGQPSNYKEVEDFIIPILSLNADGKHQINPDYLELLQNDDDIPEFVINDLKDDSAEAL
jgi:hypothetical protein